jgi:phosphocarrier protein
MAEREVIVINRLGLHARAAAKLVQLLGQFRSKATLVCRGREVNGKSIMGVMLLAAGKDSVVLLRLEGPDEDAALEAASDLFARCFDEGG